MANFFTRLLRPAPETLLAPKAGGTHLLIEIQPLERFPDDVLLQLPSGCSACFLQGQKRSRVFTAGSHHLALQHIDPINPSRPLSLIYLWKNHTPARSWQTKHQCPHSAVILELAGEYSYRPIAETRFYDYLLADIGNRNLERLDSRISTAIHALLTRQAIPASDIRRYPERLTAYLRDALEPLMLEIGLEPLNFTLRKAAVPDVQPNASPQDTAPSDIQPNSPPTDAVSSDLQPNASSEDSAASNIQPASPPIDAALSDIQPDRTAPDAAADDALPLLSLPPEPREYYCAAQGTQLGPYNSTDLQALITDGTIHKRTLIWKQGMTSWQPASTFPHLYWPDTDVSHENR